MSRVHKCWFYGFIVFSGLLFMGMSCHNKQLIHMAHNGRSTITPNLIILENDSLKFEVEVSVPRLRYFKSKDLEIDLYLRSGRKQQLVFRKVLPNTPDSDTLSIKELVHVPVEIKIDKMAHIELKPRLHHKKVEGWFREMGQLGIAEVYPDSATYKWFMELNKSIK